MSGAKAGSGADEDRCEVRRRLLEKVLEVLQNPDPRWDPRNYSGLLEEIREAYAGEQFLAYFPQPDDLIAALEGLVFEREREWFWLLRGLQLAGEESLFTAFHKTSPFDGRLLLAPAGPGTFVMVLPQEAYSAYLNEVRSDDPTMPVALVAERNDIRIVTVRP